MIKIPIDETEKSIRIRQSTKNFDRYRTVTKNNSDDYKWLPIGVALLLGFNNGNDATIKTVIFSKPKWNLSKAKSWCKEHDFNPNGV